MPPGIRVAIAYSPRLTPGERQVVALLDRVQDLRPLMRDEIAPAANRMLLRHWESKGAAFGHAWAPWAVSTARARQRKGNAGKGILRDTDRLFNAQFRERSADSRLRAFRGGLRLSLDTGIRYAIFHQVGTSRMPAREVIPNPLPDSFRAEVRAITRAYLLANADRVTSASSHVL